MNILCKIRHGSHLYGTNTENSDTDFKGVYLPTKEDLYLSQHLTSIPKSIHFDTNNTNTKNSKDDIDCEFYSLQYFLKMLSKGQPVALEMLFANNANIIKTSDEWQFLVENKQKFVSKNMKAFLGYARSQSSKYSNKGQRMQAIDNVIKYLKSANIANSNLHLSDIWGKLYIGKYVRCYIEPRNNMRMYEVCGRKFEASASINYVIEQMKLIYNSYGTRANEAETNNIDWKAVSHALRIATELQELITTKNITFPLQNAKYLTETKTGKHNIEDVQNLLAKTLTDVEKLIDESILPLTVDMDFIYQWLINVVYK